MVEGVNVCHQGVLEAVDSSRAALQLCTPDASSSISAIFWEFIESIDFSPWHPEQCDSVPGLMRCVT